MEEPARNNFSPTSTFPPGGPLSAPDDTQTLSGSPEKSNHAMTEKDLEQQTTGPPPLGLVRLALLLFG
jgi:hypothetical protein